MSQDETIRELERKVLAGDADALEALKRELLLVTVSRRECWVCQEKVPDFAWDRHHAECGIIKRKALGGGPSPQPQAQPVRPQGQRGPILIPIPGPVGARPRKEPLWGRATLDPGAESVDFFRHGSRAEGATNVCFGNSLAGGHHFFAFAATLCPDAASDSGDLLLLWDHARVEFVIGTAPLVEWPCRIVMMNPAEMPREGPPASGLDCFMPRARLAFRGKDGKNMPVELSALEAFAVRLHVPREHSVRLRRPVGLMFALLGIRLKPLAG